jgi:heme/copper-type cytochrome/quinol oxidase subunit 2
MIYLSGSFFIYLFANQIPLKDLPQYWMFTDIFYILKNVLFLIAILVFALQKPKKNHPTKPKANHHHYLDIT